jgi:hypothetical protein
MFAAEGDGGSSGVDIRAICNVMTAWPKSLPYTGPCRSGWVHSHWIEGVAG